MNLNLTETQKLAVVKVLAEIAFADGKVVQAEEDFLQDFSLRYLRLTYAEINKGLEMNFTNSLSILRELTLEDKRILSNILVKVVEIDGNIHNNELAALGEIGIGIGLMPPNN